VRTAIAYLTIYTLSMEKSQSITHKSLLVFGILMVAAYLTNILVGKISLVLGAVQPLHLGDVTEFILLLAGVVFLVIFVVINADGE